MKPNNYVRPGNTRTEMHAGRVACYTLVSQIEYASRTLLEKGAARSIKVREKTGQSDRQTDGRTQDR